MLYCANPSKVSLNEQTPGSTANGSLLVWWLADILTSDMARWLDNYLISVQWLL